MAASDVLYAALSALDQQGVYDTEREQNSQLVGCLYVFQLISSTPDTAIDGQILGLETRWQVSTYGVDLVATRAAAIAARTALHGRTSGTVKWIEFDSAPGEMYDGSEFHILQDFIVHE